MKLLTAFALCLALLLVSIAQTPIHVTGFKPAVTTCTHSVCTNLVASWKLADTSDSGPNGYALTNNNSVTFNTGQIGDAAYFASASSQYLSRASNSDLQMSGNMSFAAWVYLTDLSNEYQIIAKDAAGGREYRMSYNNAANRFKISVLDSGGDQEATDNTALSSATWYLVVGTYNAATADLKISVNDGTVVTYASTNAPTPGATDFTIGSRKYSSFEAFMNGRIDNVNVWTKVLTASEITYLYNSGTGREYPYS